MVYTYIFNPWIGCTKIAAGCKNCYAKREMRRFGFNFNKVIRTPKQTWNQVKKYRSGDKVFVCSWSDFFHIDADKWRNEAWEVIKSRPDVTWLILTKRIRRVHPDSQIPKNVWLGVSASTQKEADEEIGMLCSFTGLRVKFVSLEPLIENVFISEMNELDWIIIGCESLLGLRAGRFQEGFIEAARNIVRQCQDAGVPVFVKQIPLNGKVRTQIITPQSWGVIIWVRTLTRTT